MTDESRLEPSEALIDLVDRYEQALKDGSTRADLDGIRLAAVELGPEAAAWFDRAVATLKALRRARLFESLSDSGPSVLGGAWDDSDETGVPPTRIGRFEVRRTLGQGGFGTVYLAWDPTLRREVALKVAHVRTLHSAESKKRFQREAHIAARLDHPNLIPVYEAGEADDVPFIASVYCRGQTLGDWLVERRERGRGEPVPCRLAARIARDLAEGMAHAHAAGVLHRDLKPNNVLLEERPSSTNGHPGSGCVESGGPSFVPRITDFGLARAAAMETEDGAERWTETRSGAVLGTLRYMAPEQAMGRVREIGPSADVYSLGVILYQMLTGRVPFERDTEFDTVQAITREEPPSMRSSRRDSPRDLEAICLKCLEKDPDKRYATARELADDLARYLAGEPVRARLATPLERAWKHARRRPARTSLITLGAVAILLAGVAWRLQTRWREADTLASSRERERCETQYVMDMQRLGNSIRDFDQGISQTWGSLREFLDRNVPESGAPDLRGFEWYYFRNRLDVPREEYVGHSKIVWDVDWSPDGKLMASASQEKSTGIWDAQTARLLHTIPIKEGCSSVAFSPDGKLLAIGSDTGPINLCAVGSWEVIASLVGHTTDVDYVRFVDGGKALLSVGLRDQTLRRWDVAERKQTGMVAIGISPAWAAHVSPDGTLAVIAGTGGIRLVDLRTLAITGRQDFAGDPRGARFSPDGRHIAVSTIDQHLVLYEAATLREVTRWREGGTCTHLEFTADGRHVITACGSNLFYWDAETRQLAAASAVCDGEIVNLERLPDGEKLLVTAWDNRMFSIDTAPPDNPDEIWSTTESVMTDLSWSPDGSMIAVTGPKLGVVLLDAPLGRELRRFAFPTSQTFAEVARTAFAPDGRTLITSRWITRNSTKGEVFAWNVGTGSSRWIATTDRPTWNCAFTADGRHVLVSQYSGIMVRKADTGERVCVIPDQHQFNCAYSRASSRTLLLWTTQGMHEWNPDEPLEDLKLLWSPSRPVVGPPFFSRDGRWLASLLGGRLELRDSASGDLLFTYALDGPDSDTRALDFSPDGRTVAIADKEHCLLLRAPSGEPLATLNPRDSASRGSMRRVVQFSPDGGKLAVMVGGQRIFLYDGQRTEAPIGRRAPGMLSIDNGPRS